MKKQNFVKLSQGSLPLDDLKLEENELIAIKGGNQPGSSGSNCYCDCVHNGEGGAGNNCNCSCGG